MREEVSRAMSRVLRCEDTKKVWFRQNELSTRHKETNSFQYNDEGVLQTMVSGVIQDGAGP